MSSSNGLKALHDRLLADMPEGAEHDEGNCPLCAVEGIADTTPGGSMPETFTKEDLDAAAAAAEEPLRKRLVELEAQVQETEVGRAVADVTQAKDTEISKLQEQLDAATAARTTAENQLAETEKFWTEAISAQEAAQALEVRKGQRIAAAKEAGVFDDGYINEHADRFAAMADDEFQARLEEWRLIAEQKGSRGSEPPKTALVASRQGETVPQSQLSRLTEFRQRRIDPRSIAGGL